MTRDASYIRDNPDATGDADWIDVVNNWRDADATWLQERSVVRVATTPDAEAALANTNEGRVFYSIGDQVLYLSTTGSTPFPKVFSSANLHLDESVPGFVTVGVPGYESEGITFDISNGVATLSSTVIVGSLTGTDIVVDSVATGALTVNDSGGITITTDGSHTVHLTTGAQGLLVDASIAITGFVRGADAEFASLTVSGDTALIGVSVDSLTAAISVVTPLLEASSGSDLEIAVRSGKTLHFTSPTVADANFYYGAGTSIRMAWVVVSSSDPGVANVPEGTLWINPTA